MVKVSGRVPSAPGSHPSGHAASGVDGASRFDPSRVRAVILELTPLEITLLLGKADRWGSWMFEAGEHMVGLGLGREQHGSLYFDTPLAEAVITELLTAGEGETP